MELSTYDEYHKRLTCDSIMIQDSYRLYITKERILFPKVKVKLGKDANVITTARVIT